MKRKTIDFDNSVDGKQLKKIKKLTFQLADDDHNDSELETPVNIVRNIKPNSVANSDSESENADSEDELSFREDCETLKDEDLGALNRFLNHSTAKDVLDGMEDAKKEVAENMGDDEFANFNEEHQELFNGHVEVLKQLMANYKKGRVFPKTVKVLPQVTEWCYTMDMLDFPNWSAAAVQLMTEQFKAKGGEGVEIYYKHFLLPYIRANIADKHRLDNVLYKTLQGALFRRREFITSLLLPWCGDSLSGVEAEVLSNVLKNSTVKVDVAAPAMMVLMTQLPFSRETLVVLRALIDKKYNLPYQTIEACVEYFSRAAKEDYSSFFVDGGRMPLVWFQALHSFVALYHPNISEAGAKKLTGLCGVHVHDKITDSTRAYLRMVPKGAVTTSALNKME